MVFKNQYNLKETPNASQWVSGSGWVASFLFKPQE